MPTPYSTWVSWLMELVYVVGQLSLLLPIWAGYRQRQQLRPAHRAVWCCCLMWGALTLVAETLRFYKLHNVAVWNLVVILETLLLGYGFYATLHSENTRRYLRTLAGLFVGVALLDYFYLTGLHASTKITLALESILLIGVVLLYFEQLLQDLHKGSLIREPMFLIGVGVIIYFSGTVLIFLVLDNSTGVLHDVVYMINSILSIGLNCIIARALWLVGQNQNPTSTLTSHRQAVSKQSFFR